MLLQTLRTRDFDRLVGEVDRPARPGGRVASACASAPDGGPQFPLEARMRTRNREDRQLLIIGNVLFLIGLIAFFGRAYIAEFLGASVVFGMPGDQAAITKIRIVSGIGAFLSVVGLLIVYGTVRRNLRQDDQQK